MTKHQYWKALKAIGKGCTLKGELKLGERSCALGSLLLAAGVPKEKISGGQPTMEQSKLLYKEYGIDCCYYAPIMRANDKTDAYCSTPCNQRYQNRRKAVTRIISRLYHQLVSGTH